MVAVLESLIPVQAVEPHSLAFCGRLCLSYLYTKWHDYCSKAMINNGLNSHLGRLSASCKWEIAATLAQSLGTTGVLLQCTFCLVAIVRVPITAVISTVVYGTNTL